jgi:hypothetical protein
MSLAVRHFRILLFSAFYISTKEPTMGNPINPDVQIVFDDSTAKAAVAALNIDPDNMFVFLYAELDAAAGCKQLKQAVFAKTQEDFLALTPPAQAAGVLPVSTKILQFINPPAGGPVFLDDCCVFSRNVQIFALAAPGSAGAAPRVKRWDAQSVVVLQDDRNPDPLARRVLRLHVTPQDIRKDCTQL